MKYSIFILVLINFQIGKLHSQAGQLDPSFGGKGWVHTDFGGKDQAGSIAIQKDGKLLVGGRTNVVNNAFDFILARYLSDGNLDLGFGDQGKIIRDFGSSQENIEFIKVLSDQRILIGGYSNNNPNSTGILFQLLPDGSPDLSFGNQGQVIFKYGRSTGPSAVAIQEDGKLVVACVAVIDSFDIDWLVTRFYPNGQLDSSFNKKGWTYFNFITREDIPFDIVIQKDHKILISGCSGVYPKANFAFLRLNEDGTLDDGFGNKGSTQTDFGEDQDVAYTSLMLEDGKFITSGTVRDSLTNYDFGLARFLSDGSPDLSFGAGGKITYDFKGPVDYGLYMIQQADGKYLVCGLNNVLTHNSYIVVRFNSDGSLDTGFGKNGVASLDVVNILTDNTPGFIMQDDGKIVMVANYKDGTNINFLVFRFLNDIQTNTKHDPGIIQSVYVYPNPVSKELILNTENMEGEIELQLFDLRGVLIDDTMLILKNHKASLNWRDHWKPGSYFLKWNCSKQSGIIPVFKK
ncbi:MAG: T9SS type A sorting domain-containing protein [Saprospiraceae bacterium]|nr:T9SS type A sorting domain-containing protein [Saprospiraceae bacterium]